MGSDEETLPDAGVAAKDGYLCQNFPEHPGEEVKMKGGPFEGVMCPECGRMAGHSDEPIPYIDPPYDETGLPSDADDVIVVGMRREKWDVVVHALEEEMAQLEPQGTWIGEYPGEDSVTAMEGAHNDIIEAMATGAGADG